MDLWYNIDMITDKVLKTIIQNKLIEKGEHIVLGVSGGPDSVCLLSILHELSEEWQLTLHAVHINHCLRENDADEDQLYTEKLCEGLGIPCHVFHYDVNALASEKKITTEEAGRQVRYEAFDRVKKEIESTEASKETGGPGVKIAVAHNLNDQAETLLMRIIRGTGTDGLAGMEYMRDGVIIRPLLDVSRREIEEYCDAHNLNPRIDLTNLEPVYARNRLRLELLPLLQTQYNEGILSALNRLAQIAREDKEYLYEQVDKAKVIVSREADVYRIPRREYSELHPAVGKRLIAATFKEMGLLQDMTAVHLDGADNLMRQGRTSDRIDFPGGYGILLNYDAGELYWEDNKYNGKEEARDDRAFVYPVQMDNTTHIPELKASLKVTILQNGQCPKSLRGNPYYACLDIAGKGITDKISVRLRRPGDYIVPLGMKGTKKLQDFFVDEKIPKAERDRIPLLCCGQEVLWVVGHRINERYKVTGTSTEIVCVEYIPII